MMKRLLLLLLLYCSSSSNAQVNYQLLPESEGLPTNEVYQVFCDKKGYIWVAHAMGLSKYNGHRFVHYSHPLQNNTGVSNLAEDKDGRIWCRNFGSQIFYIENNRIHLLEEYNWKTQTTFPTFIINEDNELVSTHNQGIFVYDINKKKAIVLDINNSKRASPTFSTLTSNKNIFVFTYGEGLYVYHKRNIYTLEFETSKQERTQKFPLIANRSGDTIYFINETTDSAVACVIQQNVCKEVRRFKSLEGLNDILVLNNQQVWQCAKTGAINISDTTQKIKNLSVSSVTRDLYGNIWFSTL